MAQSLNSHSYLFLSHVFHWYIEHFFPFRKTHQLIVHRIFKCCLKVSYSEKLLYTRVVPLRILMVWNYCSHFANRCRYFQPLWSKYFANMKHFSANPVWDYLHSHYIVWQRLQYLEYSLYLKYCTGRYNSCRKSWLISKLSPALWLSKFQNRMSVIIAYIKGYRVQKGWLQIECQMMLPCIVL